MTYTRSKNSSNVVTLLPTKIVDDPGGGLSAALLVFLTDRTPSLLRVASTV
ncbi:hypothetical protein [Streptomyces sp. NPDC057690]|uniref:hypothetical protein n=1 Tax=Streptomyces sp. NPDC057690 TaxID=3346214 RepID=UPI0036B6B68C